MFIVREFSRKRPEQAYYGPFLNRNDAEAWGMFYVDEPFEFLVFELENVL